MTRTTSIRFAAFLVCAFLAAAAGSVAAQEPGPEKTDESKPDPQELARQIRRNMQKIEEELNKAGAHDPSKGEQVRKDLENLLDTMKQRQGQVVKDIDDIVEQMKCSGGGSGSKDSNENQKNSKARDRNKPQNQSKPRDPNGEKPQGDKPKPKKGEKPSPKRGSGAEDNRKKAQDDGENQLGDPRQEPPPERFVKIDLNEIWGNLPPELRQKLVDRNFDDFTPEYKEQISEYFKKTSSAPKN